MNPATNTLRAENITAGYTKHQTILHEVSADVERGKVTVLIGPNGSGKSTLLRVLAGALKPTTGSVHMGAGDVYQLSARVLARKIAFVPQDNPAPFAFTVAELVELGANAAGKDAGSPAPARTQAALRQFDLADFADRSLTNLSGGERQRTALARAWAQNTPFLLLDEPTAHLDLRHQSLLVQAVKHAARDENRGVLLVLHDLNLAATCADVLFLMQNGRIVAHGTSGDVLTARILEPVYQTGVRVRNIGREGDKEDFLWVQTV